MILLMLLGVSREQAGVTIDLGHDPTLVRTTKYGLNPKLIQVPFIASL